ncbi:hypothetical protein HMSSN139_47070 [Paenibacillus sp. HMSSN-139]|nr:hypothetical protein HMSSN139_47070 [Paenibacillus sp. HMSSN-139]
MNKPNEMIVVLDFGGQYNQLIARRIRDLGVYSELLPFNTPVERLREIAPKGIVFPADRPAFTRKMRRISTRPCTISACRSSASVTVCS